MSSPVPSTIEYAFLYTATEPYSRNFPALRLQARNGHIIAFIAHRPTSLAFADDEAATQ